MIRAFIAAIVFTLLIAVPASAQPYRLTNPTNNEESICRTDNNVFICDNFVDTPLGDLSQHFYEGGFKRPGWQATNSNISIVLSSIVPGGCPGGASQCMRVLTPNGQSSGGVANMAWFERISPPQPQGAFRETYFRWYQKFDPGYVWSNIATKGMESFLILDKQGGGTDNNPSDGMMNSISDFGIKTPVVTYFGLPSSVSVDGKGHFTQNVNPPAITWNTNQNYCIEVHRKFNSTSATTDGILEVWVDGVKKMNYNPTKLYDQVHDSAGICSYSVDGNVTCLPTSNWKTWGIFLVSYINCNACADCNPPGSNNCPCITCIEQNGNRFKYIGNIVVSTQPIGCAGGTQTPPTPNPPTNLRFTWLLLFPMVGGSAWMLTRR